MEEDIKNKPHKEIQKNPTTHFQHHLLRAMVETSSSLDDRPAGSPDGRLFSRYRYICAAEACLAVLRNSRIRAAAACFAITLRDP